MPPTFRWRGVIWVGVATSKAWETVKKGPPVPIHLPQLQEQRVGVQLLWTPEGAAWIWWGGAEDMEECDRAPLRSPYKPSASNPTTASSTFYNPSASNCCSPSLNKLAHLSKCSPWKREKRSVTKARFSHKTVKEQSGRLSHKSVPQSWPITASYFLCPGLPPFIEI